MLELEEAPDRSRRDNRAIADRNHDAVWQGAGLTRHINHEDKPPPRQAVVATTRVAGEIVGHRRSHHRREKCVGVGINDSVRKPGGLAEGADAAIDRDNELGGADRTHRVRPIRQRGAEKSGAHRLRGGTAGRSNPGVLHRNFWNGWHMFHQLGGPVVMDAHTLSHPPPGRLALHDLARALLHAGSTRPRVTPDFIRTRGVRFPSGVELHRCCHNDSQGVGNRPDIDFSHETNCPNRSMSS